MNIWPCLLCLVRGFGSWCDRVLWVANIVRLTQPRFCHEAKKHSKMDVAANNPSCMVASVEIVRCHLDCCKESGRNEVAMRRESQRCS
eukprot:4479500-Amphidinium_carterae.1